jgi:hypothetical protein
MPVRRDDPTTFRITNNPDSVSSAERREGDSNYATGSTTDGKEARQREERLQKRQGSWLADFNRRHGIR